MAGQPHPVSAGAALLAAALLAGCGIAPAPLAQAPAAPTNAEASAILPAATVAQYRSAVLRIDPTASIIVVTVRRGGALARLGHDHVVASRQLEGLVAPAAGRADLGFRLDQLTVDEAELRTEARLDTQPSAEAIAGTRVNMLTRVLDAGRYPLVLLHVDGAPWPPREAASSQAMTVPVTLSVTLHGVTRAIATEVVLEGSAGRLSASGTLQLRQSDFGITPMSVLGGAMTVQDTMELRYRLVARR